MRRALLGRAIRNCKASTWKGEQQLLLYGRSVYITIVLILKRSKWLIPSFCTHHKLHKSWSKKHILAFVLHRSPLFADHDGSDGESVQRVAAGSKQQ